MKLILRELLRHFGGQIKATLWLNAAETVWRCYVLFGTLGPSLNQSVCRSSLHQQVVTVMIGQENISRLLWGGSGVRHGPLVPVSVFYRGKPVSACPHLRQRGSSVPDASVAPHGVHQRVGGEGVVCGSRAHIPLEAHDDGPIGPEGVEVQHVTCY